MNSNNFDDSIFITINLFLLALISLMLLIELIIWITTIFISKSKKINIPEKSYQILLKQEKDKITIKKTNLVFKFNNYNKKNNCLKLKIRDFEEKTLWNHYQNLISILLIKWKKTNKKINITLIVSTLLFYLSAITAITCALIYYINLSNKTLNNINITALSILSFITMIVLVLSWLIWTMNYEKLRKELIELSSKFENPKLLKIIKIISGYKTLFPGSELLI